MNRERLIRASVFALSVLVIGASIGMVSSAPLMVVYNPSASMPVGWYLRVPLSPTVGRIVVIDPPIGALSAGWPKHIRLIKPISAVAGDHVCVSGRTHVLVNGKPTVPIQPYPAWRWEGCRTLEKDELFLVSPHRIDSVDGRIYGPIKTHEVLGVFIPVWTESEAS